MRVSGFQRGLCWSPRICLQCRRPGFDPWIGKIPWRREGLPTPVFWPGEFQGLYSPWSCKESDMAERLSLQIYVSCHSWPFSGQPPSLLSGPEISVSVPYCCCEPSDLPHKGVLLPLWTPEAWNQTQEGCVPSGEFRGWIKVHFLEVFSFWRLLAFLDL